MMDADLIERIVREVIRRLREMETNGSATNPSNEPLAVEDRVVTLATLQGRLDGVCQLNVRSDAVVTPSVQDELRDRKITLTRN